MDGNQEVIKYIDRGFTYTYNGSVGVVLKDIVKKDLDRYAVNQYAQMMSPTMSNKRKAPIFSVEYSVNPTRKENKKVKDAISSLLKSKFHEDVRPHIEHVMSSKDTELVFLRMHIARKDTEDKKAEYVEYELFECLAITFAVFNGHMVIDFVAIADQDLNNPDSMFPLCQG